MSNFYQGIAEILEVDPAQITPEFDLHGAETAWDSLAIVSTIALADECFNVMLDGKSVATSRTVADLDALVQAARNA